MTTFDGRDVDDFDEWADCVWAEMCLEESLGDDPKTDVPSDEELQEHREYMRDFAKTFG